MLGIDLGSRSVKMVWMEEGRIIRKFVYNTIDFYRHHARREKDRLVLEPKDLDISDQLIIATGYGKLTIPLSGARHIPEIQAHVHGAVFQSHEQDFTLLDIGGQDSKVVQVRGGLGVDFLTNDRCASGSGRYLENMAQVLAIDLEELALYSANPVTLNSTCAIFAETEIIARIVEGHAVEELAAGINYTLFKRLAPLLKKLHSEKILMSGGGAINQALAEIAARELGKVVKVLPEPQFNGAIGCCVYGWSDERQGVDDADIGCR